MAQIITTTQRENQLLDMLLEKNLLIHQLGEKIAEHTKTIAARDAQIAQLTAQAGANPTVEA